jgi:hypothetical protein
VLLCQRTALDRYLLDNDRASMGVVAQKLGCKHDGFGRDRSCEALLAVPLYAAYFT